MKKSLLVVSILFVLVATALNADDQSFGGTVRNCPEGCEELDSNTKTIKVNTGNIVELDRRNTGKIKKRTNQYDTYPSGSTFTEPFTGKRFYVSGTVRCLAGWFDEVEVWEVDKGREVCDFIQWERICIPTGDLEDCPDCPLLGVQKRLASSAPYGVLSVTDLEDVTSGTFTPNPYYYLSCTVSGGSITPVP